MEEEEFKLVQEEKELEKLLSECQDKHKLVRLVYEKVFENIKSLCRLENKRIEEVRNNSINMDNSSNENSHELDVSNTVIKVVGPSEEEVSKHFMEYLENTRAIIERLYLTVGKKEFENMLKDRGEKVDSIPNAVQNKEKLKQNLSKKNVNETKSHTITHHTLHTNYEYNYSDEELKEDDKRIKDEYMAMAQEFKKIVN